MDITRQTVMEVDLSAFRYNVKQIKDKVGKGVGIGASERSACRTYER